MKYQNSIEKIAEAVEELAKEYSCTNETGIGEMNISEYGGNIPCILIRIVPSEFEDETKLAEFGKNIIRIFNAYMPEMIQDPVIAEKTSDGESFFIGKPLLPLRVAVRQNGIVLNEDGSCGICNVKEKD